MSGLGARTARDARWRPSQPIREVLRASASADTRDRQQPKRSPDLAAAVGCRRPASAAGYRTTPHGGLRCQEGVLTCPGDVEIAGPGVVLASSQLPCSMPSRGPGSAPAAGERPSGRRARTNEVDAGERWPAMGSEEELSLLVVGLRAGRWVVPGGGAQVWRSGLTSTHSAARMRAAMTM